MAKPDPQTRHGKPGGTADQSSVAHGQAAHGREDLDEAAESELDEQAQSGADDWGIEPKGRGISKETKIGMALILVLLVAFGFVLYRKLQKPGEILASIKDPSKASATESPEGEPGEPVEVVDTEANQADPLGADPFGDVPKQTSAPRQIEPAAHAQGDWGFEQQEPPAQKPEAFAEAAPLPPGGDNPFTQTSARTPSTPPARQLPPQDDFNPFGGEPEPQAAAPQEPAGEDGGAFEPFPEAAAAPAPPKPAAKAPAQLTDPFGQPIGDAAAAAPTKAAPPQEMPADGFEPFPPAAESQASTATTVRRPAKPAAAPANDPFGGEPFPSDSAAGEAPLPDAFPEDEGAFEPPASATAPPKNAARPPQTAAKPAPATLNDPWGAGAFPSSEPFPPNRNAGEPAPAVYEVRNGDNYWDISRKQYGTGRYHLALAEYNRQRIPDPKRMRPGMQVMIPPIEVLETRYANVIPKGTEPNATAATRNDPFAESSGFFRDEHGQPVYRIGRRDTLTEIASHHLGRSSRWIQIYEMNRQVLKNPNDLKVGTVLRLPADASRVEVVDGQ